MRQSHGWKCCQGIRTVKSIVHPLTAPPPRGNYSSEGEKQTVRTSTVLILVSVFH